jgi:ferredoxin--NADP+ reductase
MYGQGLVAQQPEPFVDCVQMVVDADLGTGHETGHGDHLGEHTTKATVRHPTRQIDEIALLQWHRLQQLRHVFAPHRRRLLDGLRAHGRQQPGPFANGLHQIELIKAPDARMVVRERIVDAHAVHIEAVECVRPDFAAPGEQDAAVGLAIRRATTGRIRDARIPVGANGARHAAIGCHRQGKHEQVERGIETGRFAGLQDHHVTNADRRRARRRRGRFARHALRLLACNLHVGLPRLHEANPRHRLHSEFANRGGKGERMARIGRREGTRQGREIGTGGPFPAKIGPQRSNRWHRRTRRKAGQHEQGPSSHAVQDTGPPPPHHVRSRYHPPMHVPHAEPWRVAVVGSGPSAFYTAEALFKTPDARVQVDMFDRLPVPFGLVRGGVAPDHQNIKAVTRVYDKIAANPGFRFFGNVQIGRDLQVEDLAARYHQIVYAFGCETGQKLGIPGEELRGVHSATEFVGWYNGHPDHAHRTFDLRSAKRVAIVGNGNVAMDVARILLASPDELGKTDLADHALAVLRTSSVREVILLGRRGPAQAAFSPKEIEEIAELPDTAVLVRPEEAALDALSEAWLAKDGARSQQRNVKFLQEHAGHDSPAGHKRLQCRFLVGPTELLGEHGNLQAVRVQHMELVADTDGTPRPKARDSFEEVPVDLVFKAIGYRGIPVPGVPFDQKKGIVPNLDGRVLDKVGGSALVGHYAAGWCKRGPTGLIGTNSLDAKATVDAMREDFAQGARLAPTRTDIADTLRARGVDAVTWADWQRLDAWELAEGQKRGKLRHKLPSIEAVMLVLRDLRAGASAQA